MWRKNIDNSFTIPFNSSKRSEEEKVYIEVPKSKFPMADCYLNDWCPPERDLINILIPNADIDSQFSELVKLYVFRRIKKEMIWQMVESVYQSQGSHDIDSFSPFGAPGIWSTMASPEVPGAGCSINHLIHENLGTAFAN